MLKLNDRQNAIILITAVSALLFLAALFCLLIRNHLFKKRQKTFEQRVMVSAFFALLAIWLMRFLYVQFGEAGSGMSVFEKIIDSGLHALKSLSMDEEYTTILTHGKEIIGNIFPGSAFMANFYGFYTTLLNIAAPFAGGAIIFVIAAKIFPKLKLWFQSLLFWKTICYFSELNDRSLALAQSLREKESPLRHSVIVFTDTYPDSDDEAVSERIHKAKCMDAICVHDDLSNIPLLFRCRAKKFFLIDENEMSNLYALSLFLNKRIYKKFRSSKTLKTETSEEKKKRKEKAKQEKPKEKLANETPEQKAAREAREKEREARKEANRKKREKKEEIKRDEIYYFCHDNSNILIDKKFREALEAKIGKENMPGIVPVKGYRNRICDLLTSKPLFLGLDPKEKEPLNVTVFGTGLIGTEIFLSTYWCGQLLNRELFINVVSNENENDFRARIDHINPEIFETSDPNSELLRIYKNKNDKSPVYFNFRYYQTDVKHDDLYGKLTKPREKDGFRLINSNYFLIALGSDKDNLEIADLVSRYVKTEALSSPVRHNVPIAYVIYDDKLMETLKADCQSSASPVDMYPFGSMSETYNYQKIVFAGISAHAERAEEAYENAMTEKITKRDKLESDQYTYWANIAKVIFFKYKAFCVGLGIEEYLKKIEGEKIALKEYTDKIGEENIKEDKPEWKDYLQNEFYGNKYEIINNIKLAWLEHRRWNAFMRVQGFRAPTLYEEEAYIKEAYIKNKKTHKNLELKLHPCIVECDDKKMKSDLYSPTHNDSEDDLLDNVSLRLPTAYPEQHFNVCDYKKYDYPKHDL